MKNHKIIISVILLVFSSLSYSNETIQKIIVDIANKRHFPAEIALAVAKVESDFQVNTIGIYDKQGVMQLNPTDMYKLYGIDKDKLQDTNTNIELGIRYLQELLRIYNNDITLVLSHYHAGVLPVENGQATIHPFTSKYISKVMHFKSYYTKQKQLWYTKALKGKNIDKMVKFKPNLTRTLDDF